MCPTNSEVARVFEEMAGLLEVQGQREAVFKARAYRRGARAIRDLPLPVEEMARRGLDLEAVPGIGKAIAAKVRELLETGAVRSHRRLMAQYPPLLLALMDLPGVGPRTAWRILQETGATTMGEVREALAAGRLPWLPSTGDRSPAAILDALELRGEAAVPGTGAAP